MHANRAVARPFNSFEPTLQRALTHVGFESAALRLHLISVTTEPVASCRVVGRIYMILTLILLTLQ